MVLKCVAAREESTGPRKKELCQRDAVVILQGNSLCQECYDSLYGTVTRCNDYEGGVYIPVGRRLR